MVSIYNSQILFYNISPTKGDFYMYVLTPEIGIEITRRCNLSCKHCMRGDKEPCDIRRELLEKFFDEVKSSNRVVISGGEPFLCYKGIRELIEVMKEKKVQIPKVMIVTNGTVYDERIYDLLEENFEDISIHISTDDYHIESIESTYTSIIPSLSPRLHPRTETEILKNMELHKKRGHLKSLYGNPKTVLNSGRARDLDKPKEPFRPLGYFYTEHNSKVLIAGPIIYLDSLGYITEGDTEYASRDELSIGNLNTTSLSSILRNNALKIEGMTPNEFSKFLFDRERAYDMGKEERCAYSNNHITMVPMEKQMTFIL